MRAFARQLLAYRSTLAVLALLLALGPFLHGHFGRAHATGFHLDGLDVLEHLHVPATTEQAVPFDLESPAVGVAVAAFRSDEFADPDARSVSPASHPALTSRLMVWAVIVLAALHATRRLRRAWTPPRPLARRPARPGLPPPTLAPPPQR